MDVWMCECADVRIGLRDGSFFRNGLVNLLACAGLPSLHPTRPLAERNAQGRGWECSKCET